MKNNRLMSSILNAIVTVISSIASSVLSLVSTKLVLQYYGSDFNGIIATGNQLINVLLIVEGGVTLAINVSLFTPYVKKMHCKINQIMSAANKVYVKIGLALLTLGIGVSVFYTFLIKSDVDQTIIFTTFVLVIMSSAFNIGFVVKYRIMYQVSQTEYKINSVTVIFNVVSSLVYIILLLINANILLVRLSLCVFSIINGIMIIRMFKKDFDYVVFSDDCDYTSLHGTKDIMVQKVLNVLYTTSPIFFISTFLGTIYTSVYAVYYSIFNIIKMFLQSIVSAPVNGFGQLLIEDKSRAKNKFKQYEFLIVLITTCLLTSLIIMIIPFIKLYTSQINDINYVNFELAALMALILYLEIIHLPAGNLINISGDFRVAKNIQVVVCMILVISMSVAGFMYDLMGVLVALLITNICLCFYEIGYVYRNTFCIGISHFISIHLVNILLVLTSILTAFLLDIKIMSYFHFFAIGIVFFVICSAITIIINLLFNREITKSTIKMLYYIIRRKQNG